MHKQYSIKAVWKIHTIQVQSTVIYNTQKLIS